MINTDTRTVKANFLQSFTPGAQIGVLSGLHLCNVGITSNDAPFSAVTSNLVVSTLTANTITVATSGTFGICYAQQFLTLSDVLAKKDMRPLESVLNGIDKIQAYRFSYSSGSAESLGLLAQEVEAIFPDLVLGSSNKFVNYDGVVAVLVKAVQELAEKVRVLEDNSSN
jgi:hypothetical protein